MQNNKEERDISQALGSVPKVYNQRAFSCTVTIAGTGLGDITVNDIVGAIVSQHQIIDGNGTGVFDQLYIHKTRCYGTAGGYLSMSPYPHRFNYLPGVGTDAGQTWNSYENSLNNANTFRRGSLCQQYEFGISGATRPELVWDWLKAEVINNPFIVDTNALDNDTAAPVNRIDFLNRCKMITIQSTNTGGNALYIVQFDVTLRNSKFIEIAPALGMAAFGEENVLVDNYIPPIEGIKKAEDGRKAEEQANKKRKIKAVKDLTMPTLDAK